MSTRTLPATIPGLLRRGSPVVVGRHADDGGVVTAPCGGVVNVSLDQIDVVSGCLADDVALDLTNATGRAHAAWWLGGVGASWALDCDGYRRWVLHGGESPREAVHRLFEGVGSEVRHMRLRSHPPEYGWDAQDVPALDHLDPDDDTRLPDGSRWVDAEALRLVCLHVAGVTP